MRLAEFLRTARGGESRGNHRHELRNAADRGDVLAVRCSLGACVRRWAAADRTALLHEFGVAPFREEAEVAITAGRVPDGKRGMRCIIWGPPPRAARLAGASSSRWSAASGRSNARGLDLQIRLQCLSMPALRSQRGTRAVARTSRDSC